MKHTKQWIALLLAVVMTAALLSVPAFAKAPNDLGFETYVALGDSIATGLNDNTETNEDAYGSWANGYTVKLAEKLGLVEALNLDGGVSSTLWTLPGGVLNHPCDNGKFDHVGQRIVPNAVLVR